MIFPVTKILTFLLFLNVVVGAPVEQHKVDAAVRLAVDKFKRPITPIYRLGNNAVGPNAGVRPQDWNIQGNHIHADERKGLSFSTVHDQSQKAVSIKPYQLKGHDLKAIHDGHLPGRHPNHVTVAYTGSQPIHRDQLRDKINGLWAEGGPGQRHRAQRG